MQSSFTRLLNEYPKACRTLFGLTIMGILALAMYKLNPNIKPVNDTTIQLPTLPELKPEEKTTPQPKPQTTPAAIQPTPKTQIIILTPTNQAEIDCLQYGGGIGCFEENYQPQLPQYYSQEKPEEPKRGEPRNVGDFLYRFW